MNLLLKSLNHTKLLLKAHLDSLALYWVEIDRHIKNIL